MQPNDNLTIIRKGVSLHRVDFAAAEKHKIKVLNTPSNLAMRRISYTGKMTMIQNEEKTFLHLPRDLLRKILKMVPLNTLASAVQVCRTWNAEKEHLWQANFKRHFPDKYKDLQQTGKEMTDWKNAFFNEEIIRYEKLTPLQMKLFRLIKDSDLAKLAKLAAEVSLFDLTKHEQEFNEGMDILQWASFYGTCSSFIYEKIIKPLYAEAPRYVEGQTLLHWAASLGQVQDVSRIIDKDGTNIEAGGKYGQTALELASYYGHLEVARLLLDRNANIEAVNDLGCTALMFACQFGRLEVARLLLDRNANIEAYDEDGRTALQIASTRNYSNIVKILIIKSLEKYINEINKSEPPSEDSAAQGRKRSRFTFFEVSDDANLQSEIAAATQLLNILKDEETQKIYRIEFEFLK